MDPRIERQREIVARHIRGENEHDWPTVYDTFEQSSASFYDVIPMHNCYQGIDGVHQFYEAIARAFPDFHIHVTSQYDTPGCSIVEVIISGTHTGDFFGLSPTGKYVRVPLAGFYLFNEDSTKLLAERVYFDQLTIFAQLPFGVRNSIAGLRLLLDNRKAQQAATKARAASA
ncbi:MAG: ester cyclase [Acidobacteriales bacterium]|nr:ester cyclase [Terriglobales bacterium]